MNAKRVAGSILLVATVASTACVIQTPAQSSTDVTAQKVRKVGAYLANRGTGSPICLTVHRYGGRMHFSFYDYRGPNRYPEHESSTIRRRPRDQYPFKWMSRFGSMAFDFRGSSVLVSPYYGEGGPQSWLLMKRIRSITWDRQGCRG